jgi:hypothetical protein
MRPKYDLRWPIFSLEIHPPIYYNPSEKILAHTEDLSLKEEITRVPSLASCFLVDEKTLPTDSQTWKNRDLFPNSMQCGIVGKLCSHTRSPTNLRSVPGRGSLAPLRVAAKRKKP